jgi:hypothetical protein
LSFRFSAYVIHTGLYLVYLQNKISRCNFLSEVRFFFWYKKLGTDRSCVICLERENKG